MSPTSASGGYYICIKGETTNILEAKIFVTTYTFEMPSEDIVIIVNFNSNEPVKFP